MPLTVEETTTKTIESGTTEFYAEVTVEGDLIGEGRLVVSPGIEESGRATAVATASGR